MNSENKAPDIQVGIYSGEQIAFTLNGIFKDSTGTFSDSGKWIAGCSGKKLFLQNEKQYLECDEILLLKPQNAHDSSFTLHAVTIGLDFHWQRKEDQVFKGNLKLIIEDNKVTAINVISIEDYLISVISSEMKATASGELLKAHAIISRS